MPRYHFHLYNDEVTLDTEGRELANLESACAAASIEARTMAANEVSEEGKLDLKHRIDIVDEAGNCVSTVYFRDVVQVED